MSNRSSWTVLGATVPAVLGLGTTFRPGHADAQTPAQVFATADVTPSVVARCAATTVGGADWEPDMEVTITLDGAQGETIATARVDPDGRFAATATIPCDTSVGLHSIGIFGVEMGHDLEALEIPIEVVAGPGGTAATGPNLPLGLGVTSLFVGLGLAIVTGRTDRRASTSAQVERATRPRTRCRPRRRSTSASSAAPARPPRS